MTITEAALDQIWEAIRQAIFKNADAELMSNVGWIDKAEGREVAMAAIIAVRELEA